VIGFLSAQSAELDYRNVTVPFLQGLRETGYVVGQNVEMEYRWAENQYDRLPVLAAGLVHRRVVVIVTKSRPDQHRIASPAGTSCRKPSAVVDRSGADQKIRENMVSPSPTSSFVYFEFFT
jgi:hypothetical protein